MGGASGPHLSEGDVDARCWTLHALQLLEESLNAALRLQRHSELLLPDVQHSVLDPVGSLPGRRPRVTGDTGRGTEDVHVLQRRSQQLSGTETKPVDLQRKQIRLPLMQVPGGNGSDTDQQLALGAQDFLRPDPVLRRGQVFGTSQSQGLSQDLLAADPGQTGRCLQGGDVVLPGDDLRCIETAAGGEVAATADTWLAATSS